MAYRITNISTTNLAMADGSNLAPHQSKVVPELSANLQYLVSIRTISSSMLKVDDKKVVVVSAPEVVAEDRLPRRKNKDTYDTGGVN